MLEQRYGQVETIGKSKSQPVFSKPRICYSNCKTKLCGYRIETDGSIKRNSEVQPLDASDEGITPEVQQVTDGLISKVQKTLAAHWKDFVDNWTVRFSKLLQTNTYR